MEDKEKRKEYLKKYYQSNKMRLRIRNYKYALKIKYEVFNYYSHSDTPRCVTCGVTDMDILCIDHLNNNGEKDRKNLGSGVRFCRWLKRNHFPDGYQVLCFNCNQKKAMVKLREERGI